MIPPSAEVVVIGGGVIGTSVAYHLARRGCTNVLLIERSRLGGGSTGSASGAIRQQFEREIEVALAERSVRCWIDFEESTGAHLDFRQVGYLFLLSTSSEIERYRANVAMQRRMGVPTRLLNVEEALSVAPGIDGDGLLGASYCPTDGRAIPAAAVEGFARRARDLGVRIEEQVAVTGFRTAGERISALETSAGVIHTRVVVNAAGPQAADVASMVGVSLPVRAQRVHQVVTDAVQLPDSFPCVLELSKTLFLAKEGSGVLLGLGSGEPKSTDLTVDWNYLPEVIEAAMQRMPLLRGAAVRAAWVGLGEYTPDRLPVLGPVSQIEGFYCANGMSGHGFMLAPAIGEAIADLLVEGKCSWLDIGELSIERFQTA